MHLFEDFPIKIILRENSSVMTAQFPKYGFQALTFERTIFTCELDGIESKKIEIDKALEMLRKTAREMSGNLVAHAVVTAEIKERGKGFSVANISKLHFQCETKQLEQESPWEKRIRILGGEPRQN